jgi:hypothetical protein
MIMNNILHLNLKFLIVLFFAVCSAVTMVDPVSGATRFTVSKENVIFDSQTGFEWIVGPDKDTDYKQAKKWVAGCNTAGGGWRLPTNKDLLQIYQEQEGDEYRNIDPVFKTTGFSVWTESHDASAKKEVSFIDVASAFGLSDGETLDFQQSASTSHRAFGIRLKAQSMQNSGAFSNENQSSVEGKLVDWNDKPVADVKIKASQLQPVKGYEHFEAVTDSDGTFRIKGLFPSSAYMLKPWSDKWACDTTFQILSAPKDKTVVLSSPIVISLAYLKSDGSTVVDLVKGKKRFDVSADEIVFDSETGLEWVIGPDRDMDYAQAKEWVAGCKTADGGWRMPTHKELAALYIKGINERNMDPAFKTTISSAWAEPHDSTTAIYFCFDGGLGFSHWCKRTASSEKRALG